MAKVLTAAAQVVCNHQGIVAVAASQRVLTAGGSPVLVLGDMESKPVAACGLTGTGATPCTTVVSTLTGVATKLAAGSKPVLLDTATGATNAGTWQVRSAGQTVLDAT
jgi:hypothetical protein